MIGGLTTYRNGGEPTGPGGGRQGPPCPECSHPMKLLGESCEEAEQRMGVEDYYSDGSRYTAVGTHNTGVSCPECGYCEAEPPVHD